MRWGVVCLAAGFVLAIVGDADAEAAWRQVVALREAEGAPPAAQAAALDAPRLLPISAPGGQRQPDR